MTHGNIIKYIYRYYSNLLLWLRLNRCIRVRSGHFMGGILHFNVKLVKVKLLPLHVKGYGGRYFYVMFDV